MNFPSGTRIVPAALVCVGLAVTAQAQLSTQDLNSGLTPEGLVQALLGEEIAVSNVSFSGAATAAGTFAGGAGIIGFGDGIILSSGNIANVIGPNTADGTGASNGLPGDPDLDAQVPFFDTFDAACLEFDFECESIQEISFRYVFSSEEYNEYVDSLFNDVFGFFVNGVNAALLPDGMTTVAINNVNCGNPYSAGGGTNCEYFINNDLSDGGGAIDTEMDGLTVVLTLSAQINPGLNHIKLCIADAGDTILDSNVFIEGGSFVCGPQDCAVCDLGAVVTVDDEGNTEVYGTVQMAANAAAMDSSIETVVVCEGYYPEDVLIWGVHDVRFVACGEVTVAGFLVKLSSGVTLEGFDVEASLSQWGIGIWLHGWFDGSYANQDVSVLGCTIRHAAAVGVRIDPGNTGLLIDGCEVSGNGLGISTGDYGGGVWGSLTVRGSSIDANLYGGLLFATDTMVVLEENQITDNGWYGLGRSRLPDPGSPETIQLLDNTFSGNNGWPIPGQSDADIENYDQVFDFADSQAPYTP